MAIILTVDMERVGDIVTVGDHVVLYTVRADLAYLDGRRFNSVHEAESAARSCLRAHRKPRSGSAKRLLSDFA